MSLRLSQLLGKKLIGTTGQILGQVRGTVLDLENRGVSHLLTTSIGDVAKTQNVRQEFMKNSIEYSRVKKVTENIIVGEKLSK